MDERRYMVGERVLVSRAQDGENHEEATVTDYYVLLVNGQSIPSVVVDFDDGQRLYLTAAEPNVLPIEEEDEPQEEAESDAEEPVAAVPGEPEPERETEPDAADA